MEETPVVVCGGGLVGLTAAVLLAHHGIPPLVVERHPGTSQLPKSRSLTVRSMEVFRSAGIEDALRAVPRSVLNRYTDVLGAPDLVGAEEYRTSRPAPRAADPLSPTTAIMVDQDAVEPVLREEAARLGARLRFGTELEEFEQDGDHVLLRLRERRSGSVSEVRTRYLIAADGHRSPIRSTLGIEVDRVGQAQPIVNIPFEADLSGPLAGRPIALAYLSRPEPNTILTRLDRDDRWVLMVPEGSGVWDEAGCTAAIRAAIGDPAVPFSLMPLYESAPVQTWELASWTARRFRAGNILLAGDSAHVMAPAGGLAGNTGIQDAHNLAWKIALVCSGAAGDGLLDTYEAERRPVALITGDYCRARQQGRTSRAGEQTTTVDPLSMSLGYHQYSTAVAASGDPSTVTRATELVGAPGTRLPHGWLRRSAAQVSTVDLSARGFHLLAGPDGGKWVLAARAAADQHGLPLTADLLGADLHPTPDFDPAGALALRPDEALLTRPDGYVAWRSPEGADPAAALETVLTAVLAH
ncbi:FAD-dependent monooxygenase [Amycolatopsis sp. NPDC003676]